MQKSALYPTVYVLGNGQLGRMLRYAGAPLDIHVQPLDFNAPLLDLPRDAVITAEIERWESTPLTEMLATHDKFVNKKRIWQTGGSLIAKILTGRISSTDFALVFTGKCGAMARNFHRYRRKNSGETSYGRL